MSNVNIYINEAAVTAIHEFNSFKGYGVDYFVEAQSCNGTVYLQVVAYDNEARSYCQYIHEGDYVRVTGDLKVKVYKKKDGTDGTALIIEKPIVFSKIISGNSSQQLLQNNEENRKKESEDNRQNPNAVTATAVPAENKDKHGFITDTVSEKNAGTTALNESDSDQSYPRLKKIIIDGTVYEAYDDDDPDEAYESPKEDDLPF